MSSLMLFGLTLLTAPSEEPYVFEAAGQKVDAFRGTFTVPENRNRPDARMLKLHYVRFPATTKSPSAPIVYLAGGPGGSGVETARGRRFPLFMRLREVADVIAFDQRGTGGSDGVPPCVSDVALPRTEHLTRSRVESAYRSAASQCAKRWTEQGIDIHGWNTLESARDLDALRRALRAPKISLWSISYGTHLAFAAIKVMDSHLERIVMTGAEGPDETVKLPSGTEAYLDRLQTAINQDPKAKAAYPDLKKMLAAVFSRLERETIAIDIEPEDGNTFSFRLSKLEAQLVMSFSVSDPARVARVLPVFAAAAKGEFNPLGQLVHQFIRSGDERVDFRGMPELMDAASGVSPRRLDRIQKEATGSLLGDALNFPMPHLKGAFGDTELPADFRAPSKTRVPTLLLSGTLDGRTYVDAQWANLRGFTNAHRIIVENAGHNLFMSSNQVQDAIVSFLSGQPVRQTRIRLPNPRFGP